MHGKKLEKVGRGEYEGMKVKEIEFSCGYFQSSCHRPGDLILSDPPQFSTISLMRLFHGADPSAPEAADGQSLLTC